jgi:hypothetical protein
MTSYRVKRRAFLAGIGAAAGLRVLLQNLEASAQGQSAPPRLLVMHWPLGTIPYYFEPTGTGTTYETSRILAPFEDAGLRDEMIVLFGLTHAGLTAVGGGGVERGILWSTTGANSPGTRITGGERDDAVAGGPSFDQIFARHVPELAGGELAPLNATADDRTDSYEVSTRCLSYGYETRSVMAANPANTSLIEHEPLIPERSPLALYQTVFGTFVPGGGDDAAIRALKLRKSVLDSALAELKQLRMLAPAAESEKLEAHEDAIRKLELELQALIDGGGNCEVPTAPGPALLAKTGSGSEYGLRPMPESDSLEVEAVGNAHLAVIRAAFQCNLTRVATFQWSSALSHVRYAGLYPPDPEGNYSHVGLSHSLLGNVPSMAPPSGGTELGVFEFLTNVHTWLNQKTARALLEFKMAKDVFGANLLDHTIVPFITDIADVGLRSNHLPALIFGGRALGMRGGQYQPLVARPHNDLWMSIAQAYLKTTNPLAAFSDEVFFREGVAPIDGLWQLPT